MSSTNNSNVQVFTQNQVNQNLTYGTNAATVTTTQSQSTSTQTAPGPIAYQPPATGIQVFDDGSSIQTFDDGSTLVTSSDGTLSSTNATDATAPSNTQPAAAAATDDNFGLSNTISGTNALLNTGTSPGSLIQPQPNVLDSFASYTYNLAWYLLTPAQYAALPTSPKIDTSAWSLLVQSGGASIQQQGVAQQGSNIGQSSAITGQLNTAATPNRNKYFMLDYYLDDLEILTQITGTGPSPGNQEFSFKVIEPNGLTLLVNLNNAVRDFYQDSNVQPIKAQYCMVIRFYGWDIYGNLITDPTSTTGSNNVTPNTSNAVITRYYPFLINEFHFKYAGRGVEYDITGLSANIQYGKSSATASLPYNIELTGKTVNDVLAGNGSTHSVNANNSGSGRETTNTPAPANSQMTTSSVGLAPDSNGSILDTIGGP